MTDKEYPCEQCKTKKVYAKMDFHWFDHEDCPFVCPFVKEKGKDDDEKGKDNDEQRH